MADSENPTVRPARPAEVQAIGHLVEKVIGETYPDLVARIDLDFGPLEEWLASWVAERDGVIVGAGRISGPRVTDLWVAAEYRNQGVGQALLSALEHDMAESGVVVATLRCAASNRGARRFYRSNGWHESRSYTHEVHGDLMVDFEKRLS